jgi:hypothetical protein
MAVETGKKWKTLSRPEGRNQLFQSSCMSQTQGEKKKKRRNENPKLTQVVRAHLQRLITPHHQPDGLVVLVLQKPDVASTTLFPFSVVLVETEELGAPAAGGLGKEQPVS